MSDSESLASRAHRLSKLVSRRRGAPHDDERGDAAPPAPQPQAPPPEPPASAPPPEPGGRLSDYFAALGIEDAYPDATQAAAAPAPDPNAHAFVGHADDLDDPLLGDGLSGSLLSPGLSSGDGLMNELDALSLTEADAADPVPEKPIDDAVLASFGGADAPAKAAAAADASAAAPQAEDPARLTYTFDEEFTDVIRQVAEHMECDPADIITTAVNFYISELYRDAETDAA